MAEGRQLGDVGDIDLYVVSGRAETRSNKHAANFSRSLRGECTLFSGEDKSARTVENNGRDIVGSPH